MSTAAFYALDSVGDFTAADPNCTALAPAEIERLQKKQAAKHLGQISGLGGAELDEYSSKLATPPSFTMRGRPKEAKPRFTIRDSTFEKVRLGIELEAKCASSCSSRASFQRKYGHQFSAPGFE
jgi:hypothetical protein